MKCCVNLLILRWACGRTAPVRGRSSPVMIFNKVDFPNLKEEKYRPIIKGI